MNITHENISDLEKQHPKLYRFRQAFNKVINDVFENKLNGEDISTLLTFHANALSGIIVRLPDISESKGLNMIEDIFMVMRNRIQTVLRQKEDVLSFIESLEKMCEDEKEKVEE